METKGRWRHSDVIACTRAVVLVLAVFCVGVVSIGAAVRPYRVAVLTPGLSFLPVLAGLREGLTQLGYVEGKDVTLMVENTQGEVSDLAQRAERLVALQPDVFVTMGTPHTRAAQQATSSIPIVFVRVGDPLYYGLAASYASSQNNLTGVSVYSGPLAGKRLEILQEIAPESKRILAVVAKDEGHARNAFQHFAETAAKMGLQVLRQDVTTREELEHVLRTTPADAQDAIYHVPSFLVSAHIDLLIEKARRDKLPMIVHEDSMVDRGALVSYGGHSHPMGKQAAKLVRNILQGARPADLPIQTPDTLFLTINVSTAREINLTLPLSLLERVDRMAE